MSASYGLDVVEVFRREKSKLAAMGEDATHGMERQVDGRDRVALLDQRGLQEFEIVVSEFVPRQRVERRCGLVEEDCCGAFEGLGGGPTGVRIRLGAKEDLGGRPNGARFPLGEREDGGDADRITS